MTAILPSRCPLCRSDITDNVEARTALLLAAAVDDPGRSYGNGGNWDYWESRSEGAQMNMGTLGIVALIAKSIPRGESQGDDAREAYMIFDVDGILVRKDGYTDSYGDNTTWTGGVRPVARVERQVTTYEYQ